MWNTSARPDSGFCACTSTRTAAFPSTTGEALSRALDPVLDEADPIPDSYVFEVSSAGAERELKRPGDFARFMGSGAEVRLYKPVNGSKSFVGTLSGYRDGDVTLTIAGKETTFEKAQIAQVRLRVL